MNIETLNPEVTKDLIPLINSLSGMAKNGSVKYSGREFKYVLLDDMLAAVKKNENFAFMQPLGMSESGEPYIQCILIHKTGAVIASDPYRLVVKPGMKKQDEGAEITYSRRYCMASFFGIASDDDTDAQTMDEVTKGYSNQGYPSLPPQQKKAHKPAERPTQPKKQNSSLPDDLSAQLNQAIKDTKALTGLEVKVIVGTLESDYGLKMSEVTVDNAQAVFDALSEIQGAQLPF